MNNFSVLNKQFPVLQRIIQSPYFLLICGLAVFSVMAVMSWVLYKERMLNFDPAFFSFLMVQEEAFSPVLGRYGTVLSQLLPYALMKGGAELNTILQYYSLSFVLLYILYLLIIGVGFKNKSGIVALCIALTLTFRDTFYYPTAELYQAIGLSVLLWVVFGQALKNSGIKRLVGFFFSLLLVVFISSFHQLGLFTTFFVMSVEYIRRKQWKDYAALAVIILSVAWFLFRIKFLTVSEYEQERLLTISSFAENLRNIRHLKSMEYFAGFLKNHLVVPLVVSAMAIAVLLFQRKKLLAGFFTLYAASFWLVIVVGLHAEKSPIMLQNYYTVFGLFAGVLIAVAIEKRKVWFQAAVVLTLGMFSLKEIYHSRHNYSLRTEFVQHINDYGQQFPEKKYVLHAQHLPWGYVWINWALSIETFLSSEVREDQESVTYFSTFSLDTLDYFDVERPDAFLGPAFEPHWFSVSGLNKAHFSLKSGPYRILNTNQKPVLMNTGFLVSDSLVIKPLKPEQNKSGGFTSLKIELSNNSQRLLTSLPPTDSTGVFLYYRIKDQHNFITETHIQRILMDLYPQTSYVDIIVYNHPAAPNQKMEIGFVIEDYKLYFPKTEIRLNSIR